VSLTDTERLAELDCAWQRGPTTVSQTAANAYIAIRREKTAILGIGLLRLK